MDTEESFVFELLPCCHSFHTECIQSLIKKEKSCPICKTYIPLNEKVNVLEAEGSNVFNNAGDNRDVNRRIDADATNILHNLPQLDRASLLHNFLDSLSITYL